MYPGLFQGLQAYYLCDLSTPRVVTLLTDHNSLVAKYGLGLDIWNVDPDNITRILFVCEDHFLEGLAC